MLIFENMREFLNSVSLICNFNLIYFSGFNFMVFSFFFLHVFIYFMCISIGACVEVRGQLGIVGSLLPPCGPGDQPQFSGQQQHSYSLSHFDGLLFLCFVRT